MLREFVYLDEVSVYSLLASRSGPVATEFTDTESNSLNGELASSLAVAGGLVKGETKARVGAAQSFSSQVVRKSSAQARFKQLLENEQDALFLHAGLQSRMPEVSTVAALDAAASANEWVLDPAGLRRGQLFEIEVELDVEEVYAVSETLSAMIEIIENDPELFGLANRDGLRQGITLSRVLEQLLVGLIPIRARAVHYQVVLRAGRPIVVHEDILRALDDDLDTEPLFVVGVAETGLFWKDVRRILFARNRYLTMCRLAHDGINDDWTPIKLVDVLAAVVPEIAGQLDGAGRGLLAAIRESSEPEPVVAGHHRLNAALATYASELAAVGDMKIEASDLLNAGLLLPETMDLPDSVEARRALFAPVTAFVADRLGTTIDRVLAAQLRGAAFMETEALITQKATAGQPVASPNRGRCLDSEFIAIYW